MTPSFNQIIIIVYLCHSVYMLKIAYNLIFHYDLFRPTAMIDHISQIKDIVEKENIHYLVLDKDDTIVPVYQFKVQDKKIHETLNDLKDDGVFIVIASNSVIVDQKDQPPEMRVNNWNHFFDIHFSCYPKPYNGSQLEDLMKSQRKLNPALPSFDKAHVAIVGDRLLTDVHMGNLMGWKSYLVKPLQQTTLKKHGIGVFVMRYFENFLIRRSNFTKYQPSKSQTQ